MKCRVINVKRKKTSNRVLIILGIFLLLFILCMIVTFWVKGAVPDTLITCVMGGGLGEAVAMAAIKISKVVKENDQRAKNKVQ